MNTNTNRDVVSLTGRARIDYDPETNTYQYDNSWGEDSVLLAVVGAVADVTGQEQEAMEPLHSALDPEALETLLTSSPGTDVHLTFSYEECLITATSDGEVTVQPLR